jgi:hypothetical protein
MDIDLQRRYELPSDFFDLGGSVVMKLSAEAAIASCLAAAEHGLIIAKIEGGIWHHPVLKPGYDCIWDGADPPVTQQLQKKTISQPRISFARKWRFMTYLCLQHRAYSVGNCSFKTPNPAIPGLVFLALRFIKRGNNNLAVLHFNSHAVIGFKSGDFKPAPRELKPRIKKRVFTGHLVRPPLKAARALNGHAALRVNGRCFKIGVSHVQLLV